MNRLSDSMEEGTILRWLKSDGDGVRRGGELVGVEDDRRGDELVEIETDKATMTYEADQDGVLEIVAAEGATLAIGEVIASIGEGSGPNGGDPAAAAAPTQAPEPEAREPAVEEPKVEEPEEPAVEAPETPAAMPAGEQDERVKAS